MIHTLRKRQRKWTGRTLRGEQLPKWKWKERKQV